MPAPKKVEDLRECVSNLSAVHSSLTPEHRGWANCDCQLAKRLRELSAQILKLLARRIA